MESGAADVVALDGYRMLAVLDEMVAAGQLLAQVYQALSVGIRQMECRHTPVTQKRFEEWFHRACRRSDGSEYSRDWRETMARQFNEVGQQWLKVGLVSEELVVTNYRRVKRRGTVDEEIDLSVPPSHVQRLRRAFLLGLSCPGSEPTFKPGPITAFCCFAFATIALGSACWRNAFAALASLRWEHIRTAAKGYLLIPRAGGLQRLYVPPVVAACALAVGEYLRGRRKGEPDLEASVLSLLSKHQDESTGNEQGPALRKARSHFNAWLRDLCHQVGVPAITLQPLALASQRWLEMYAGNEVAAAVQGIVLYNPVAEEQRDVFGSYRGVFRLPREISAWVEESEALPGELPPGHRGRRIAPRLRGPDALEKRLNRLTSTCKKALEARPDGGISPLRKFAVRLTCNPGADADGENVEAKMLGVYQRLSTNTGRNCAMGDAAEHFDIACQALWLDSLLDNKAARTINGYCSEGLNIKRLFPDRTLVKLDQEDSLEVIGSVHEWEDEADDEALQERDPATRKHLRSAWKSLHTYMRDQLHLPVEEIDWRGLAVESPIHVVYLLSQRQFERLLDALWQAWKNAEERGDIRDAMRFRNGFWAANLAYFFGLRLIDVCQLGIEDMVLRSLSPYLCVRYSKGDKSRLVYAHCVPECMLKLLRLERDRRWLEEEMQYDAHLLIRASRCHDEDQELEALRREVSSTVIATMDRLGLRPAAGDAPVFHTLRHCFANRLFVLGVPIPDIARAMGHSAPDTTAGSYLHAFDFLQEERLETLVAHLERAEPGWQGITIVGLAQLLGIGRTGVIEAIRQFERGTSTVVPRRRLDEFTVLRGTPGRGDQRLIPYEWAVRLVAWRLGLQVLD
jgi:integrase